VADVLVGLLAIVIGAAFCFRGYLAMRVIIPVWGAFTGFVFGGGLVASFADEGFLASALGWLVAVLVALLFGALAYIYYEVSVVIAMAAVGFSLGTAAMVAIGAEWSWVVILAGVIAGAMLAVLAIVVDLPMALLTILTAMAGATATVIGVMLLFNALSLDDFTSASTTSAAGDSWWWSVLYVVLVVVGIVAQYRATERMRVSLRDSWTESGGRHLRRA
jgi:hypothetical protein